jgi:signal transduction histidine kinase
MPRDQEIGKALNLLIHDLRAPLGMALGYLRLITEHRLTSADEQDRALAQSLEALGRMSRLCSDASAFLAACEAQEPAAIAVVPAGDLAARVTEALQPLELICAPWDLPAQAVKVPGTGSVPSAVATILGTVRRSAGHAGSVKVSAHADATHLTFLAGTEAQRTSLMADSRTPVDPWRGGHGLALPLACLQVAQIGGSVWTTSAARPAVGVSLPFEGSPS